MIAVYKITNTLNGKSYIGSAVDVKQRWHHHKHKLRLGNHANKYLQHAWNKYTEWYFTFEILEICLKDDLINKEQHYIDTLNSKRPNGYNLRSVASSNFGMIQTDESNEKRRIASTGYKHNENTIKLLSEQKLGNINRRNPTKWPHLEGCRCKCRECKFKRNENQEFRRSLNKMEFKIIKMNGADNAPPAE